MNQPIEDLIERYGGYLHSLQPDQNSPKIHVDEIASKVASFYEKIRGFIDYKEEHLLRKNFIDRVFRRRFFLKELTGNIGEPMIREIIRSGRLPNDTVPETKINEIDSIVNGLILIVKDIRSLRIPNEKEITEWVVQLTISAIEENLFPPLKETMLSETMFWSLKEKMTISGSNLTEDETNLQLFIAIQRALLKVDEDQLNYRLVKFIYPNWNKLPDGERAKFAADLPKIKDKVEEHLKNPFAKYFFKLCNRYNTVFYLVGDIIDKHYPAEEFAHKLEDEGSLSKVIKEAYRKRFEKEGSRLNRLAFLSVLSIFLSKILVAVGIEYPVDKGWLGLALNRISSTLFDWQPYFSQIDHFSWLNTAINIVIPPVIMLIIVLSIKMPSDKNIGLVLDVVKNIFYGHDGKGFGIVIPKKKRLLTRLIIGALYAAVFLFTFYMLYKNLLLIHFSYANIAIFAFFTSLVAATGQKVHNRAKEISMEEKQPKFLGFVLDVFALPFITVGRWGLAALSKLNIMVVIFNLIIELPFQIFIQFIENFRSFIKSKKEEIS